MTAILKIGAFLICLSAVGVGAYFLLTPGHRPENANLPAGLELGVQTEEPQPAEVPEPSPTETVKTASDKASKQTPTISQPSSTPQPPTPTIFPWPTPMLTVTPVPTVTPQPTTTPMPTDTPTPTPTIFIAGSGSGCTLEGWRRNCRESCGFQDGRRGYWNIDVDQLANGKIVYTECIIVE